MKNGATIHLEASWALNTLDVHEAQTSLCGTKAGADMKEGLRINDEIINYFMLLFIKINRFICFCRFINCF